MLKIITEEIKFIAKYLEGNSELAKNLAILMCLTPLLLIIFLRTMVLGENALSQSFALNEQLRFFGKIVTLLLLSCLFCLSALFFFSLVARISWEVEFTQDNIEAEKRVLKIFLAKFPCFFLTSSLLVSIISLID